MDESLKAGDLAVVSRVDHECATRFLGRIVTFDPISDGPGVMCPKCGQRNIAVAGELCHKYGALNHNGLPNGIPARWLRRIPPLEELEGVKREEGITA